MCMSRKKLGVGKVHYVIDKNPSWCIMDTIILFYFSKRGSGWIRSFCVTSDFIEEDWRVVRFSWSGRRRRGLLRPATCLAIPHFQI